jgi:hypothetical protein
MIILLVVQQLSLCSTPSFERNQLVTKEKPQPLTYIISYEDVNILMISKLYQTIIINGDHNSSSGKGHDSKITFQNANALYTIGILIIWDDEGIIDWVSNGGWIHTKLVIFNYDGWMSGQFGNFRLKLIGHCELINKTVYRG